MKLIEFADEWIYRGQIQSIKKSSLEKYEEWHKQNKGKKDFRVISVQRTDTGVFVVYEK